MIITPIGVLFTLIKCVHTAQRVVGKGEGARYKYGDRDYLRRLMDGNVEAIVRG